MSVNKLNQITAIMVLYDTDDIVFKCLKNLKNIKIIIADNGKNKSEIIDYFETIDRVLGILSNKTIEVDEDVKSLIEQRDEARIKKDWKKSDEIRDELLMKGF